MPPPDMFTPPPKLFVVASISVPAPDLFKTVKSLSTEPVPVNVYVPLVWETLRTAGCSVPLAELSVTVRTEEESVKFAVSRLKNLFPPDQFAVPLLPTSQTPPPRLPTQVKLSGIALGLIVTAVAVTLRL